MSTKYTKGIIISTTVLICGTFMLFSGWSAWNTSEIVNQGKLVAASIQWQSDYGKKIDSLVSTNPQASLKYYQLSSSTSAL